MELAAHILGSALVFCFIAGVAALLNYLSVFASAQTSGFPVTVLRWTQYALLTADVALFVVMLIAGAARFLRNIASDHASERAWEAKHD